MIDRCVLFYELMIVHCWNLWFSIALMWQVHKQIVIIYVKEVCLFNIWFVKRQGQRYVRVFCDRIFWHLIDKFELNTFSNNFALFRKSDFQFVKIGKLFKTTKYVIEKYLNIQVHFLLTFLVYYCVVFF